LSDAGEQLPLGREVADRPDHVVDRTGPLRFLKADATDRQKSASDLPAQAEIESLPELGEVGFAIPYIHNGQPHDHVPDFIVRLANTPATWLILETKGFDDLAGQSRRG
jgi:hypothetical protein